MYLCICLWSYIISNQIISALPFVLQISVKHQTPDVCSVLWNLQHWCDLYPRSLQLLREAQEKEFQVSEPLSCQSGSGIHLCKANYKLPITCTSLKWTEIHPLIDCCIFSNKAADWFTCALIAIYVGLWCSSCERFWESGFTELLQTPVARWKRDKEERKKKYSFQIRPHWL